jgi:hypothetical protein
LHLRHLTISLLTWLSRPNWRQVSKSSFWHMPSLMLCTTYLILWYFSRWGMLLLY